MAVIASPSDEEAVARWDGDGGSQPSPSTTLPARRDSQQFLRFIRLVGVAEARDGEVSFPLGILWPYTSDLRRVRDEFDAAGEIPTTALLDSIGTLHGRIAFAPGSAGRGVADTYDEVRKGIETRGHDTQSTRLCSRCRNAFPALDMPGAAQREQWWLCPPCHDKLLGKASRAGS